MLKAGCDSVIILIWKTSVSFRKKRGDHFTLNAQKAVFMTAQDVQLTVLKIFFPAKDLILTSESGTYNTETKDLNIEVTSSGD